MRDALRRCPGTLVVAPRMARYQEISDQVFAIFREFTPIVEGLSLDEAFLDVTASQRLLGGPEVMGAEIRRRIAAQTGLTASVGIASNKLLAKIASDLNKPNGMCRIDAGNIREILDPLPIHKLFGVGQKTLPKVLAAGIRTFGDARVAGEETLWRAFGKHGKAMQTLASGLDDRPVEPEREEKSISAEETFDIDLRAPAELKAHLKHLADRTASRLRAQKLLAGRVSVKIRRGDFTTYTRQRALGPPTQETAIVSAAAEALLEAWLASQPRAAVRLLGVGVGDLQVVVQPDLFSTSQAEPGARLDSAVDDIRDRFGAGLLTRASLLPRGAGNGNKDPI